MSRPLNKFTDALDRYIPEPNSGCWLWIGGLSSGGYASFSCQYKTYLAHRLIYKLLKNPIPYGMTLDHLCRVRFCVNPAHLEAVTLKENTHRGFGLAGNNARKTHCHKGHPLEQGNVYLYRSSRTCRICHNECRRLRRQKHRMAQTGVDQLGL